jgi:hypothetical protein
VAGIEELRKNFSFYNSKFWSYLIFFTMPDCKLVITVGCTELTLFLTKENTSWHYEI